jgi:arylsulfatase A
MSMPASRPNVVLVNCDDLGYGDLGCYGSGANDTPHIDRLAAGGCKLTSFYMASAVCSPSRAAMLTGCYPPRVGFGDLDGRPVLFPGQAVGLDPAEFTLPRLFKAAGYATAMVGKWHCGDQPEFLPTRHGFDSYYGLPYSNDMGRQFEDDFAPPLPLLRDGEVIQQQPDQTCLTERYVEECVRFLRANRARPFFLYLAHLHVHLPHYVSQNFMGKSRNGPYGAAVATIDWATGVIMHELRELGIDDNTLVLFTSDNGSRVQGEGGSNGFLRGIKGQTWEGGQRVPCIARWPGHIPSGSVSNKLCSAMDFLPTLAEILDVPMEAGRRSDGRSILDLLLRPNTANSPHETFLYYLVNGLEAVRDARWKLHFAKRNTPHTAAFSTVCELYDLLADPGETINRYDEEPGVVARLNAIAAAARSDLGDSYTGVPMGPHCRPAGRVKYPRTLTTYDPDHPYIIALYDLKERG